MRSFRRSGVLSARAKTVALAIALILGPSACGGSEPAAPTATIQLEAPTLGGGELAFDNLAEHDAVLWFWAPW